MTCALQIEPIAPGAFVPAARPLPPPEVEPLRAGDALPFDGEAAAHLDRLLTLSAASRARMEWEGALASATAAADVAAGVSEAWRARALVEPGCVLLLQGEYGQAEAAFGKALSGEPERTERWRALLNLGVLAALRDDRAEAARRFDEAAGAAGSDPEAELLLGINRSQVMLAEGDIVGADGLAARALRLARREKNDPWTALAGMAVAHVHLARGTRNEARTRLGDAVRAFARAGDVLRQVQCHYLLGEIAYDSEDPIRAGAHYRDGLALARQAAAADVVELLTLRFEHR